MQNSLTTSCLRSGKHWPQDGSLHYTSILQLELFCKKEEKWNKIPYVQVFIILCQNIPPQRKCKILIPKARKPTKPIQ